MHIKGRYNCSHIDSEGSDEYTEGGVLEIVKGAEGEYLVQIISPDGEFSTAIIVGRSAFDGAMMEDSGFKWIGSSGGEDFYDYDPDSEEEEPEE